MRYHQVTVRDVLCACQTGVMHVSTVRRTHAADVSPPSLSSPGPIPRRSRTLFLLSPLHAGVQSNAPPEARVRSGHVADSCAGSAGAGGDMARASPAVGGIALGTLLALHRTRLTGSTCDWAPDGAGSSILVRSFTADRLPNSCCLICTATACVFSVALGPDHS